MSSIKKNIAGKQFIAKKGLKVGIVQSEYNSEIGEILLKSCRKTLLKAGVLEKNIQLTNVPGAFEIPYACQKMIQSKKPDVVIALGAIIKGGTPHFDYIASTCSAGIMDVSLNTEVPIVFGVLTTNNLAQAKARTGKGVEAAQTALQLSNLKL
ncbi:6,7-dimethyl-8-ribityllumazine synthase [Candidatus Peregrinibacteria bacterium]|nr:6,7-dimethyl-8-ribityllumazine synthase [Candidatus Peregrinibacteria bacterium]